VCIVQRTEVFAYRSEPRSKTDRQAVCGLQTAWYGVGNAGCVGGCQSLSECNVVVVVVNCSPAARLRRSSSKKSERMTPSTASISRKSSTPPA